MKPNNKIPQAGTDPSSPSRRRTGKIARLPREHRELINLMLRDGTPYPKIIQKLAYHGHKLDKHNLSRWYVGGHQDWIEEQAWLEEMRVRLDFAKEVVNQPNANLIDEASLRIAVIRMYNLLLAFDPLSLKNQLATQPTAYSRILGSLCKITSSLARSELRRASTRPFVGNLGHVAPAQSAPPPPAKTSRSVAASCT